MAMNIADEVMKTLVAWLPLGPAQAQGAAASAAMKILSLNMKTWKYVELTPREECRGNCSQSVLTAGAPWRASGHSMRIEKCWPLSNHLAA